MILSIIYLILIGILIYIFIGLDKDLTDRYYHKDLPKNTLGTGKFFPLALIFPRDYFRKDSLWEGWFVYLFSLVVFFLALYLFFEFVRSLQ